jgi:hypothetical protein
LAVLNHARRMMCAIPSLKGGSAMDPKDVHESFRQRVTDWTADTVTITPPPSGTTGKLVMPRKFRASLTISLVWGVFCGAAMVLARAFFFVPNYYNAGKLLLMIRGLVVEFLIFTAIGTVFGLLFTTFLALSSSRVDDAPLSAGRSAAAGAVAGIVFGAGAMVLTVGFILIPLLITAGAFGLLGAGIGAAMVNSARRGADGERSKTLSS